MQIRRALASALTAAAVAIVALGPSTTAAASSSVECGQLAAYTPPDPTGPADGSLQIGFLPAWDVLAAADISPAAAAALSSMAGSGPICLAVDFDDMGSITALDFAAQGDISGVVTFDATDGFYILADRLLLPTEITDAYPGLAALFVTSYQAGTMLSITFTLDPTTGQLVGVDGRASFCGIGSVTQDGNGQVGDAIIPAAVLGADDLDALDGAPSRELCATVHATVGFDSDTGDILVTTDVDVTRAASAPVTAPVPTPTPTPTPMPTSTPMPTPTPTPMPTRTPTLTGTAAVIITLPSTSTAPTDSPEDSSGAWSVVWLAALFSGSTVVIARRFRPGRR